MIWYVKKSEEGEWKVMARDMYHLKKIPRCWGKLLDDLHHVEEQLAKKEIHRRPHFRLVSIEGALWKLIYDPVKEEEQAFLRWLINTSPELRWYVQKTGPGEWKVLWEDMPWHGWHGKKIPGCWGKCWMT